MSAPSHQGCPKPLPAVTVTCFDPNPATTQGEAPYAAALADRHHWHPIIVVSGVEQTTRARIRVDRCYRGSVLMVPADPTGLWSWVSGVFYEWAATAKALTLQRGC